MLTNRFQRLSMRVPGESRAGKGPSRVPQGTPAGSPKAAKIYFFRGPGAQAITKGQQGHSRDPRKPRIDQKCAEISKILAS